MNKKVKFHEDLKNYMDEYVNSIYDCTEKFPKGEIFGLTSQLRRAALSAILNYIEGYARRKKNVLKNFLEISYGSLKESKYLIYFAHKRGYLSKKEYRKLLALSERIGAMLWGIISKI